jgi:hypothetical protein
VAVDGRSVATIALLREIYGADPLPKPFDLIEAALLGATPEDMVGLSHHARRKVASLQGEQSPLLAALELPADFTAEAKSRARVQKQLGSMLQGLLAERLFEEIYKTTLGTSELRLEDSREARDDTDYRVLNGKGRPVFRINIKFHGTLFRQAQELVGLAPEDCFALATYKIKQGLDKQEKEVLPYLFVVVSCPISAADVGAAVPNDLVELYCMIKDTKRVAGKRNIEEKIVDRLAAGMRPPFRPTLDDLHEQLASAPWRVISARRADTLLRKLLFERVYAVRIRKFTSSYRNAEVDMHLSLSGDMTPLHDFLEQIGNIGLQGVAGKLERGLL